MIFKEVEGESQEGGSKLGITDNAAIIQALLTDRLYKRPIEAILRESVSNARDSHVEAGQTLPVEVFLRKGTLIIKDRGIGLTKEEFEKNIGILGNSTKRQSTTAIGCFGIGSLSPFGYTNQVFYTCIKNGQKFIANLYKGDDGIEFVTTDYEATTEPSGVEVKILIDPVDFWDFRNALVDQLRYFSDLWFEVEDEPALFNNFRVLRGQDYNISTLTDETDELHICLGDVYYPIDWKRMAKEFPELKPVCCPVALKFGLNDGLMPIPNREDIHFTKETCAKIMTKMEVVATQLVTKFNATFDKEKFIDKVDAFQNGPTFEFEGLEVNIKSLLPYSKVKCKTETHGGVSENVFKKFMSQAKSILRAKFSSVGKLEGCKLRYFNNIREVGLTRENVVVLNYSPRGVEREYLKEAYSPSQIWQKKKLKLGKVGSYGTYRYFLQLNRNNRSTWRQQIKEFQILEEWMESDLHIEPKPTQEWLEERKKNRKKSVRTQISKEEVKLNFARAKELSLGSSCCVFDNSVKMPLSELYKTPQLTIYSSEKDVFNHLFHYETETLKICYVTEKDKIKLQKQELHNFMDYSQFMKGDNRPFQRLAMSILAKRLINKHGYVFNHLDKINKLSNKFYEACKKLKELPVFLNNNLEESILSVASEFNLFDPELKVDYDYVEANLHYFDFLPALIKRKIHGYEEEIPEASIPLCVEILKGRKFKLNLEYYGGTRPDNIDPKENVGVAVTG